MRRDGETLSRRTLDRLGGHQIAWVALVGVGVLLLGISGVSLLGSVWASVSAVSTVGPAMGEIGAFGRLEGLGRPGRLALVPLMMAGRMSIPPLMAGVGLLLRWYRTAVRQSRFLVVRLSSAAIRVRNPPKPMARRPVLAATGPAGVPPRGRFASTTAHVIGIALAAMSVGMLACGLLEAFTTGRDTAALTVSALVTGTSGGLLWYLTRPGEIRKRHVFSTVASTWVAITCVGAVPFVLAGTFAIGGAGFVEQVVNSVFESASGYSASGSTVLADFETPGRGLMMYRQLTHWYGGMGVVVLAVAVLPFLGVGGLELITAEAPGPSSDRLTPRVSETARRLWMVYIGFTICAAVAFFVADGFSSVYDAVAHAFTVAATGASRRTRTRSATTTAWPSRRW